MLESCWPIECNTPQNHFRIYSSSSAWLVASPHLFAPFKQGRMILYRLLNQKAKVTSTQGSFPKENQKQSSLLTHSDLSPPKLFPPIFSCVCTVSESFLRQLLCRAVQLVMRSLVVVLGIILNAKKRLKIGHIHVSGKPLGSCPWNRCK